MTDAEVLQEILHRYVSIARPDAIQPTFDALLGLVDVDRAAVERAKDVAQGRNGLSARNAVPGDHANPRHQENLKLRSRIRRLPGNHSLVLRQEVGLVSTPRKSAEPQEFSGDAVFLGLG